MPSPALPSFTRRRLLGAGMALSLPCIVRAQERPNPPLEGATILPLLPPKPGNPRNTEGAFVTLRDGSILFAYTRFSGGTSDHAAAVIASRLSTDGGRTWTSADRVLLAGEGDMNVMSVSFLRLPDGRIAFFYLRKNSTADCKPMLRFSSDETATWSEPIACVEEDGYWVLNNDRVIQLPTGRLLMPLALHRPRSNGAFNPWGVARMAISDDQGATWRLSKQELVCPIDNPAGYQEPGVVALKDGRILLFLRTQLGSQYMAHSADGGDTWSTPRPSPLISPLSPASIKRIPGTGQLLAVWNDHRAAPPEHRAAITPKSRGGLRTPLTLAISEDEGITWKQARNLLDSPEGWYCYTAIHFTDDAILLAFASGGDGLPGLSKTDIARVPIASAFPPANR